MPEREVTRLYRVESANGSIWYEARRNENIAPAKFPDLGSVAKSLAGVCAKHAYRIKIFTISFGPFNDMEVWDGVTSLRCFPLSDAERAEFFKLFDNALQEKLEETLARQ